MFGDPHILTLFSENSDDYQTCNEMETFENSDPGALVAAVPVVLIQNEYYKVTGWMGRFTSYATGSFLAEVLHQLRSIVIGDFMC